MSHRPNNAAPETSNMVITFVIIVFVMAAAVFIYNRYVSHKVEIEDSRNQANQRCSAVASPTDTIFVVIPSFDDPECPQTICDLYAKAVCPYRVFVGVCDYQRHGLDGLDGRAQLKQAVEIEKHKTGRDLSFVDRNVRFFSQPVERACGAMAARSIVYENLYRNEMYIMTCDAHMIFAPDWDLKAIEQLRRCKMDYMRPVLTTQPDDWPHPGNRLASNDTIVKSMIGRPSRFLCIGGIAKTSGLPLVASRPMAKVPARPCEQMFYSPCFSFTFAVLYKDVPFDPNYKYMTSGEDEIATSARMWTAGWSFIVPFEALSWHKPSCGSFVAVPNHSDRRHSEKRLQVLLGLRDYKNRSRSTHVSVGHDVAAPGLSPYALGSSKSLREYEVFSGVDFPNCRATQKAIVGVVNINDPIEIICKFGSNEAYAFVASSTPKQYKYNL